VKRTESGIGLFCSLTTIYDNEHQAYATLSSPTLPLPSVSTRLILPDFRTLCPVTSFDPLPALSFSRRTGFPVLAKEYAEERDVHVQLHLPRPEPFFDVDFDLGCQRCHGRIQFRRD